MIIHVWSVLTMLDHDHPLVLFIKTEIFHHDMIRYQPSLNMIQLNHVDFYYQLMLVIINN